MGSIPVGFRFHPTEEEIISHYLTLKINGCNFDEIIPEIDLYKWEPWDLRDLSPIGSGDQVWYFFCRLDYKYANSKRANRLIKTGTGFWKLTGKVRDIKARGRGEVIGTKRNLVFHYKFPDSKPVGTSWVIHEYQLRTNLADQGAIVLCKLKDKTEQATDNSPCDEGEPSCLVASGIDNPTPQVRIIEVDARPVQPQVNSNEVDFNLPFSLVSQLQETQGLYDEEEVDPTDFVDSLLAVPDEYYSENTTHVLPNDYIRTRNLSGVYAEDRGDRGTIVVHEESANSNEHQRMRAMQGFAAGSAEARPTQINCIQIVGEAFPRIHKPLEPPSSCDIVQLQRGYSLSSPVKRSNTLSRDKGGESIKQGAVVDLRQKAILDTESEKERETFTVIQAKPDIRLRSNWSDGNNWRGHFIHLEIPPSSHRPSPPSVYLVKALLGLLLFIFFFRELLILH